MNIYIKSKNISLIPAVIQITNLIGNVLHTMTQSLESDTRIPLVLETGIYLVTIHTRKGDYLAKIIVP